MPSGNGGRGSVTLWGPEDQVLANSQLFMRKPLAMLLDEVRGENRLRRVLGPVQLTSRSAIGAVIGAGIFVATGAAAHNVAGPALMLSYTVAGMTCVFAALCYAEFASMVPVAGSAYTYAYADARRAVRLDHRLGPGAGVRRRRGNRRQRLVGLFPDAACRRSASTCPAARSPRRPSSTTRTSARSSGRPALSTCRR